MHKNFLQSKSKFLDEQFPPNINSLIKGFHPIKKNKKDIDNILLTDYKDISWKRDSEISNNNNLNTNIFPLDNIFINKIIYNKLSNPNLFYALNILGENPYYINNYELSYNNKYLVLIVYLNNSLDYLTVSLTGNYHKDSDKDSEDPEDPEDSEDLEDPEDPDDSSTSPALIAFIEFIIALCKPADADGNILI